MEILIGTTNSGISYRLFYFQKPEAPRNLQSLTWIKAAFNNNATALWWPSWWESATAGHNFGKGPSNDYSIKV
jgi:hypothetical protein